MSPPLLDPPFLASLERLALLAKRLPRGAVRSRRRTRAPDGAGEFRDRRAFADGDDLRHVDWAGYARLSKLLVKLFESEEPREVWVLLDLSRSMAAGPGGPRKIRWARRAAAACAFLALARHDRAGLAGFSDSLLCREAPGTGGGVLARIVAAIEAQEARGKSDPVRAVAAFLASRSGSRRGLAVLVTDGLWRDDPGRPLAQLGAAGLEPLFLHAIEPLDRAPPLDGEALLVDSESGRRQEIAVDAALLDAHARTFDAHATALEHACARARAVYVPGRTERPLEEALMDLLREGLAAG